MDELIYRFLLQAGFPRAAVVTDLELLPLAGVGGSDGDGNGTRRPTFAIVDPGTGDRLALVDVVGALDGDGLRLGAAALQDYGRRFGGRSVQGFLVRVDASGTTTDEQVQFYRVWPTETLERVSAKAFPDLESMRTWQLLAERRDRAAPGRASGARPAAPTGSAAGSPDDEGLGPEALAARAAAFGDGARADAADAASGSVRSGGRGVGAWLPGAALVALAVADALVERAAGDGFLNVARALTLTGAATLLAVPALVRRR